MLISGTVIILLTVSNEETIKIKKSWHGGDLHLFDGATLLLLGEGQSSADNVFYGERLFRTVDESVSIGPVSHVFCFNIIFPSVPFPVKILPSFYTSWVSNHVDII